MNSSTSNPLVLVVDDEPIVLESVSSVLARNGYRCQSFTTAEEAIAFAKTIAVDLIISDINLGTVSGLEMCEQIREDENAKDTPVMFLSGAQIPDVVRRSHEVGGTYYLRKPFDPEVLIELVDKAMWMPHLIRHRADQAKPHINTGAPVPSTMQQL